MQRNRLLLYARADDVTQGSPSLRRRVFSGSGMEQAMSKPASYDNNDKADFRQRWPQLVAAGAFRQQDRMKIPHE